MRTLTIARCAQEIDAFRGAWEKVLPHTPHTIFQSFLWNRAAAQNFMHAEAPFVVKAESDSGVCIIPACVSKTRRRISLLGEELFDYRNYLWAGDESLIAAAWEPIRQEAAENDLDVAFHSIRADVHSQAHWVGLPLLTFTQAPCILASTSRGYHHASLAANLRQMTRAGITRRLYNGSNHAVLEKIYSAKAKEPDSLFCSPLRAQMIKIMCSAAYPACEIFTLEQRSSLIAALVTFRDQNWRRFYTIYVDRAYGKFSPGITLLHAVIKESLEAGLDCDLMTGEQPYKLRLVDSAVPLFKISASREQVRASVPGTEAVAA